MADTEVEKEAGGFVRPTVEVNTYRKANPLTAKIIEHRILYRESDENDVRHIVLDAKAMNYFDGQSVGVLPPGENDKGKPHAVRLYSIASLASRAPGSENLCLIVKRYVEKNPETGELFRGVASNYLCDLKVGDEVVLTGPAGRKFVLPVAHDIHRPYIFIATGTGIAPFRGFLQRLYKHTPQFNSPVYLLFGVKTTPELYYHDEFSEYKNENFHYLKALSREMKNAQGGRYYVNDLLRENEKELWPIISDERTIIYMCGLKGMEEGVAKAINEMALKHGKGENYYSTLSHRMEDEVY
ncbi:MAG: Ferredoxin--NADP reductase [Turneriella sp.]|nr:Ferredoxin--NADP reductase [Turneriella sp.]